MKFNTVIIGGGLSGLICGIRLQQNNHKCIIVSTGQSALHFSSGSFDLYSKDAEGNEIGEDIKDNIAKLIQEKPEHPYAKIGMEHLSPLINEAKTLLAQAGISTHGDGKDNHYRLTPMGKLMPTWLTQKGHGISLSKNSLPHNKKAIVFEIDGYLDHFPHFVADELSAKGIEAKVEKIELSIFDVLRLNPAGMIATSIARELDKEKYRKELIEILKSKSNGYDTIVLPACVSMQCDSIVELLEKETGKQIVLVPTLPPSVAGSSMQHKLVVYFKSLGGVYMLGDTVNKVDIENNKIDKVFSTNHTNIPFYGDNYVLASGGFFSKGIVADNVSVKEPLLGLDIDYNKNRFEWYKKDPFEDQEYQSYGVRSTKEFKGMLNGSVIENLYVVGAILNGHNPIKEGSGGGVSILSALHVADQILKK